MARKRVHRSTIWRRANRLKDQATAAARRYGIPRELYIKLHKQQKGKCAIETCGRKAEVLDHDHDLTGEAAVRGLLCHDCNLALGMIKDSRVNLIFLEKYLHRHLRKRFSIEW